MTGYRRGVKFTKAVATGNDFVIIDTRELKPGGSYSKLAKKICDRKYGVGADGLLLIEKSREADFTMRIFNPDGSEAEMCGNGSRCAALYAATKKIAKSVMRISTLAGVLNASVKKDIIKVRLTDPKNIKWNLCLMIDKCPYKLNFVDTGVPHTIFFTKDLENVDVKNIGSFIRNHGEFSPEGTNADFVEIIDGGNIRIRTYERGVEDETLACGTGAVAGAVISAEREKMKSPVIVHTRSGEKLKVHFEIVDGNFTNVYLEGKASLIYEGVVYV